jgi:hypothetical protein
MPSNFQVVFLRLTIVFAIVLSFAVSSAKANYDLNLESVTPFAVKLTWQRQDLLAGTQVYRQTNSKLEQVATISRQKTSFLDQNLSPNNEYQYYLCQGEFCSSTVAIKTPPLSSFERYPFYYLEANLASEAKLLTSHWSSDYVNKLWRFGIIQGKSDGLYYPDLETTRAEFVKIVVKSRFSDKVIANCLAKFSANETVYFQDVLKDSWSAPFVCVAYEYDLLADFQDYRYFKPKKAISRSEALRIILVASKFKNQLDSCEFKQSKSRIFADLNASFTPEFCVALNNNLVNGYLDGNFHPQRLLTRGQSAKLAVSILDL